jgi:hypothetical protein
MLTGSERERLRREIDRARRERIGTRLSPQAWVSIAETSTLVGVRIDVLRPLVRQLGIKTRKRAGVNVIPVSAIDLLRAYCASR